MKIPVSIFGIIGIATILSNNYIYLHDVIFEKHQGAIHLGYYAYPAIILCVVVGSYLFLVLGGFLPAEFLTSYLFDPAKIKNRKLNIIIDSLNNIDEIIGQNVEKYKELSENIGDIKAQLVKIQKSD